jgi:hypothetical protein
MRRTVLTSFAGNDCGSSYINQALKLEATKRIKDQTYLDKGGLSRGYTVENDILLAFEHELKRSFDTSEDSEGRQISINIRGLRANKDKNFGEGIFYITRCFLSSPFGYHRFIPLTNRFREQMAGYFSKSLDGTVNLVKQQLVAAEKGYRTVQVIHSFSPFVSLMS